MNGGNTPCEYTLAEKPCVDALAAMGYHWLGPAGNVLARDGQNQVLLRDELQAAVRRINGVSDDVARAVYHDLLALADNAEWTSRLRGNYSRTVPGEPTKKTIRLIDFLNPANNTFTVTNQLTVAAQKSHRADVVAYVNGVPLAVIEAKSPLGGKDKTGEAFEQIKQYERDVPRLFHPNLLNVVTDGVRVLYGATGAASQHWAAWRDPWPRKAAEFASPLEGGLWAVLEPGRLLDLLAHFVVFEKQKDSDKVVKKLCRYQQFRAVNKIVARVLEGKHRRGLVWHTQGSGKSLTMAYATLKLKTHLTVQHPALASPNILVLTDRIDLDDQISNTFRACGLPNPRQVKSVRELHDAVHAGTTGLTMLSTVFKFEGSRQPVKNSGDWIVLVDECHRTQEKDLGAYLRATLPAARFFGFTGTPIKKNDKDTYENFGAPGEGYLDRYSIDDAVADGATVPIRYTGRKTEWQVDPDKLDSLFDQWFANEPEDRVEAIKKRGVTIAELAKHPERVRRLAFDLWAHFRANAEPDGFKAQVVAVDREAIVLYKRALDEVIAADLAGRGVPADEARDQAAAATACVYSASQEDAKPSEDPYTEAIRRDLVRYYHDDEAVRQAVIPHFLDPEHQLKLLIVCNKLLTGFDAPVESVMYLDSPLRDHNLLQAIARTNRVAGPQKQFGLIVDYIGVTNKLDEALASYREADVQNALRDLDVPRAELKAAHSEVIKLLKASDVKRGTGDVKKEYDALVAALGAEDEWYTFRRKGKEFVRAYEALSPDPAVLDFTADLKWVAGFLHWGALAFEKKGAPDLRSYSAKIREMLAQHLHVTGISTVCKLRHLTDPDFWEDFAAGKLPEELETAAIRKSTELKKILAEKVAENPLRFGPFSQRVLEVLRRFEAGQIGAAEALKEYEQVVRDLQAEERAHERSKLNERAYGVFKILEAFRPAGGTASGGGDAGIGGTSGGVQSDLSPLERLAAEADQLYASDESAPPGWHLKEQLRKELRQAVRLKAHQAGLIEPKDLKGLSERVEDYALKVYVRVA